MTSRLPYRADPPRHRDGAATRRSERGRGRAQPGLAGARPTGALHLLPRLVAAGNVSRVGLAEVVVDGGVPVGVERRGVVLAPDAGWERGVGHGGVEDPRVTWVPSARRARDDVRRLRAAGAAPRARRVRQTWSTWRRLGPLHFAYEPELDIDLNLFPNKDACSSPSRCRAGRRAGYAMLHRPMWDLGWLRPGRGRATCPPASPTNVRASGSPTCRPRRSSATCRALDRLRDHRLVALQRVRLRGAQDRRRPAADPRREGWLLIHHGVVGELDAGFGRSSTSCTTRRARCCSTPMTRARARARTEPLLEPETDEERAGTVANVVFPTAIEEIDGGSSSSTGWPTPASGSPNSSAPSSCRTRPRSGAYSSR